MKRNAKTAGETATTITFMADWLDFTDHRYKGVRFYFEDDREIWMPKFKKQ